MSDVIVKIVYRYVIRRRFFAERQQSFKGNNCFMGHRTRKTKKQFFQGNRKRHLSSVFYFIYMKIGMKET
jgi:hypothetical protein